MEYAVIITRSFDPEVPVHLFETENQAKDFLKEAYYEERRVDTEENGWTVDSSISPEGNYARIAAVFDDGTDVTEYRLGQVRKPA